MRRSLLVCCLVVVLGVLVIDFQTEGFRVFTSESKRRLLIHESPRPLLPVQLETHRSEMIGWDAFSGRYLIVDFIYTGCETLCHALGSEFAQMQKDAVDLVEGGYLHLLTVSFDGENDAPQALKEYIGRFSDDDISWTAARVLQNQTDVLEQFGVVAVADGEGGFIHNAALHLVSPQGELVKIVDYDDVDVLMESIRGRIALLN